MRLLDPGGYSRDQTAAADRHKQDINVVLGLFENFLANRALARDHQGVVERVDENEVFLFCELAGVRVGIVVGVAVQNHLAAESRNCFRLYRWRRDGHDNDRSNPAALRGQGYALRVIAG